MMGTLLADKPLPHNPEAERAFLGAVLLDSLGASDSLEQLEGSDFHLPLNQLVFRAMKRLRAEGKPTNDLVVLLDAIQGSSDFNPVDAAYIAQLSDGLPKVANLPHYIEIIKGKAQARRLIEHYGLSIDKLVTANGNLPEVLREIHSSHIGMEFRTNESNTTLFRTAADLAEESDSAEFVVKPYVLAGAITDLVAKIKAGKTTYVLGEVVREALAKGPVVYLTEQPMASFRVALQRASLLGREDLIVLPFNAVTGMDWPSIAALAIQRYKDVKAVLLVVDTLSRFCGLDGDSENDSGAALAAMKPLQEAAGQGVTSITVRHERKSGGEIGDAGRGSSAFGGAADTLLALRRPEGRGRPTIRTIECVSRFEGLPPEAVYEYIEGRYQYLGTETDISEREAETAILAGVPESEDKAKTLDELLEGSKVARTTAYEVAKALVKEGKLSRIGTGKRGKPFRFFLSEKDSSETTHIYRTDESEAREGAL